MEYTTLGRSGLQVSRACLGAMMFAEAKTGLCNEEVVRTIVSEGPARIAELVVLGVAFDRREGSSRRRKQAAQDASRSVTMYSAASNVRSQRVCTGLPVSTWTVRWMTPLPLRTRKSSRSRAISPLRLLPQSRGRWPSGSLAPARSTDSA